MLKKVIWATDGSPTTKSEYPVAKDLAESSGAKLIVAHAGEMVSSDQAGIFVDSTETLQATLERTVDNLKRAGLDAELALVKASQANAAQTIADFAQNSGADIIVAGNRGYGPVSAIFLGSFTFRLLQVAPCPVVVVPTGRQRTA
jgi:nucleotide-binding universal stress UspA family protein